MPTYAIGDIQGCYDELQTLLKKIRFNRKKDRLWFTGDLVNRGPKSLEVLRFVKGLGDRAVTVLGNHDLHLLAIADGRDRIKPKSDTFDSVLATPDRDELLEWLRHRPILHRDKRLGYTMIHAGLPPQWKLKKARKLAEELEAVLRGKSHREFFANMYGNRPVRWSSKLEGWDRLRFITNCLTRMRYCDRDGNLCMKESGPPGTQPSEFMPWFTVPGRASAGKRILFGHWSSLEINTRVHPKHGVFPLDSGCLWGGTLTCLRLEDGKRFDLPCRGWQVPKSKTVKMEKSKGSGQNKFAIMGVETPDWQGARKANSQPI